MARLDVFVLKAVAVGLPVVQPAKLRFINRSIYAPGVVSCLNERGGLSVIVLLLARKGLVDQSNDFNLSVLVLVGGTLLPDGPGGLFQRTSVALKDCRQVTNIALAQGQR